jgi:hypothetical protein
MGTGTKEDTGAKKLSLSQNHMEGQDNPNEDSRER